MPLQSGIVPFRECAGKEMLRSTLFDRLNLRFGVIDVEEGIEQNSECALCGVRKVFDNVLVGMVGEYSGSKYSNAAIG